MIPTYVILSDEMNVGMTGNSSGPGSIEWIYNSANVTEYTGQGTIKAAQSAGRPYLILFWHTWIGVSVQEVDVFSRVADRYYQDYTFIKMNLYDYWQDEFAYTVRAVPAIHFYSKDGVKKGEVIGNVKFSIIESDIKKYLL